MRNVLFEVILFMHSVTGQSYPNERFSFAETFHGAVLGHMCRQGAADLERGGINAPF